MVYLLGFFIYGLGIITGILLVVHGIAIGGDE